MANIPAFADLANYRINSFTGQITYRDIGYTTAPEERTVGTSAPYILILHESPRRDAVSSIRIIDVTAGNITLQEVEATQTLGNNQFRVQYDEEGNGQIEFNVSQSGHDIEISYYGAGSVNKIEILQSVINAISRVQIQTLATDTILSNTQTAGILTLELDCRDGNVTATLPDAALNEGLQISVNQLYKGGRGIIKGKGVDTIAGYSEIYVDDQGNGGLIYSNGVEWKIQGKWKHTIKYFEDYRPNLDWTDRELGSIKIEYDNKNGSFIVGETIREEISLYEAIIIDDDGTYLYVKNADNNFTNNREITGLTSGSTCDVNEATGSTKNGDSEVVHNTDRPFNNVVPYYYYSTDATESNTYEFKSGDTYAIAKMGTDTNKFLIHTRSIGIMYLDKLGVLQVLVGQDAYYSLFLEVKY